MSSLLSALPKVLFQHVISFLDTRKKDKLRLFNESHLFECRKNECNQIEIYDVYHQKPAKRLMICQYDETEFCKRIDKMSIRWWIETETGNYKQIKDKLNALHQLGKKRITTNEWILLQTKKKQRRLKIEKENEKLLKLFS